MARSNFDKRSLHSIAVSDHVQVVYINLIEAGGGG